MMLRLSALTSPPLTESPTPSGLPIASTGSPTCTFALSAHRTAGSLRPVLTLMHRQIDQRGGVEQHRLGARAVRERHDDFIGADNDMPVGRDLARRVDDEA